MRDPERAARSSRAVRVWKMGRSHGGWLEKVLRTGEQVTERHLVCILQ